MDIADFVNQIIDHEDYFITNFRNTDLWAHIDEARLDAIEVSHDRLINQASKSDLKKVKNMNSDEIIAADQDNFYERYQTFLEERLLFGIELAGVYKAHRAGQDVKRAFIRYTFENETGL